MKTGESKLKEMRKSIIKRIVICSKCGNKMDNIYCWTYVHSINNFIPGRNYDHICEKCGFSWNGDKYELKKIDNIYVWYDKEELLVIW